MVYTENISFEWDENKHSTNLKKHGIHFSDAVLLFYDFRAVIEVDNKHSLNELRYRIIGYSPRGLLFVVFVKNSPHKMRLITARKCTKKEKRLYVEKNKILIE